MIYLGSPYTHWDKDVVVNRVQETTRMAVKLWSKFGLAVYSPIMHWHHAAQEHSLPTDANAWLSHNLAMLRRSDKLFVLKLDGWKASEGLEIEIKVAEQIQIPIIYIDPNKELKL